mgnify:CR=1 FL=1
MAERAIRVLGMVPQDTRGKGGHLVGALTVDEGDEVMVVMERGNIVRTRVDQVGRTGRNTMGVSFATPSKNDSIVAVARNPERVVAELEAAEASEGPEGSAGEDAQIQAVDSVADAQVDGVTSPHDQPEADPASSAEDPVADTSEDATDGTEQGDDE